MPQTPTPVALITKVQIQKRDEDGNVIETVTLSDQDEFVIHEYADGRIERKPLEGNPFLCQ